MHDSCSALARNVKNVEGTNLITILWGRQRGVELTMFVWKVGCKIIVIKVWFCRIHWALS